MNPSRQQLRQLARDNRQWPEALKEVPREDWTDIPGMGGDRIAVYRSREFLVQVFAEKDGINRLSVNRTSWDHQRGSWSQNVTWDELQRLKTEAGYADQDAVEVYPSAGDVVNVANMRHLWILPNKLPFAWRGSR